MWSTYLIDTETLALNLGREDLVIIDVRGQGAYTSHIPGAVHSTWHEYSDPQATAKGLLDPDVARLEKRLQALGVNNSSDVVVYANPFDNWGDEGRMFWMCSISDTRASKSWTAAGPNGRRNIDAMNMSRFGPSRATLRRRSSRT